MTRTNEEERQERWRIQEIFLVVCFDFFFNLGRGAAGVKERYQGTGR